MTSSLHARGAERVLRILCKHFGKFPGQTLPIRWLALEWTSTTDHPVDITGHANQEHNLDAAIEYSILQGWVARHASPDKNVIELTEAGYRRHNDVIATNSPSTHVPRELLKRLKNKE